MGLRNILARNVLWNWSGMAIQMGAGFVVAPFLVHQLGETSYGLWILIASLTGYFDVLDLGIRSALGRHIALHRANSNAEGVKSVMATGLALLCCQAALIVLATTVGIILFFHLFDVPDAEASSARLALILIAVNLAAIFLFSIFDSALWAYQRFDLINQVEIPSVLTRMGLTFYFVGNGHGLVALAVITLGVTLVNGVAKMVLALHLGMDLRFGIRHVRRETAATLFGFGVWCFLLSAARTATTQLGALVVGSRLAVSFVTPFSVAARLVSYANSLVVVTTGVLTPLATAFHATQDHQQQRRLFLEGGKYCFSIAIFFTGMYVVLGESLIRLWMGSSLTNAAALLTILALGELLPMSQWVTYSLAIGSGRHRVLALFSLVEVVCAVVLSLVLSQFFGIVGICTGLAVPAALSRGLGPMVYGARLFRVSGREYVLRSMLPALAATAGPVICLAAATRWKPPSNWPMMLLYLAAYSLLFAGACALVLVGRERSTSHLGSMITTFRHRRRVTSASHGTVPPGPVVLETSEA